MDKNRNLVGDIQLADYTPMFMGAFGGSKEEAQALADFAGGFDAEAIKGLGVSVGEFSVDITPEDGKLNINCANGSETSRKNLRTQLKRCFSSGPTTLFQSADGRRLASHPRRPGQLRSWTISTRTRPDNGERGSGENYGYENLNDSYLAKNNYLDYRAKS